MILFSKSTCWVTGNDDGEDDQEGEDNVNEGQGEERLDNTGDAVTEENVVDSQDSTRDDVTQADVEESQENVEDVVDEGMVEENEENAGDDVTDAAVTTGKYIVGSSQGSANNNKICFLA